MNTIYYIQYAVIRFAKKKKRRKSCLDVVGSVAADGCALGSGEVAGILLAHLFGVLGVVLFPVVAHEAAREDEAEELEYRDGDGAGDKVRRVVVDERVDVLLESKGRVGGIRGNTASASRSGGSIGADECIFNAVVGDHDLAKTGAHGSCLEVIVVIYVIELVASRSFQGRARQDRLTAAHVVCLEFVRVDPLLKLALKISDFRAAGNFVEGALVDGDANASREKDEEGEHHSRRVDGEKALVLLESTVASRKGNQGDDATSADGDAKAKLGEVLREVVELDESVRAEADDRQAKKKGHDVGRDQVRFTESLAESHFRCFDVCLKKVVL